MTNRSGPESTDIPIQSSQGRRLVPNENTNIVSVDQYLGETSTSHRRDTSPGRTLTEGSSVRGRARDPRSTAPSSDRGFIHPSGRPMDTTPPAAPSNLQVIINTIKAFCFKK